MAYILAILKKGTTEQRSKFVFSMFQTNGVLSYWTLDSFSRQIGVPADQLATLRREFGDLKTEGVTESQFVSLFDRHSALFSWMRDLVKPYSTMEDAEENDRIAARRRGPAKRGARMPLVPELEKLVVSELRLDDAVVEGLRLTFVDLQTRGQLTVPFLTHLLNSYEIASPLAKKLAEWCGAKGEITLYSFIDLMARLTQADLVRERNRLLFSLFAQKGERSIKMYRKELGKLSVERTWGQ